jgi:hypothetical protein
MKTRPLAAAVLLAALVLPASADPASDARVAAARAKVDAELNARIQAPTPARKQPLSQREQMDEAWRLRREYAFKAFDNIKGGGSGRTAEDRIADAVEKIARNQRDFTQGFSQSWADCGNGTYGGRR